ncbi:MAG: Uncharacterised protein [Acidimicrobiales bacterium AG-410-I20]|nr:MAG: Uncharacterised protein [Acidimicrobiales bacterium AG-410-I20]
MIWLFIVLGVLLVVAIAFAFVGATTNRLQQNAQPVVFEVEDAVDWVAEQLPDEAAGQLTYSEVVTITRWWLEYFDQIGLTTEHGQEIGDEALSEETQEKIAELDDAVDYVVARSLEQEEPLDSVAVVVVVDLLRIYLAEMGAITGISEEE